MARFVKPTPDFVRHCAGRDFLSELRMAFVYYRDAQWLRRSALDSSDPDTRAWRRRKGREYMAWCRMYVLRALGTLERDRAAESFRLPLGVTWEEIAVRRPQVAGAQHQRK
jgi:hypothetical protein